MNILPLLTALVLSLNTQYITKSKEPKMQALMAFYGTESLVQQRSIYRVTDADQWKEVVARHYGSTGDSNVQVSDATALSAEAVDVNWGACIMLAFFDGTVRDSKGLRLQRVEDVGDVVTVTFSRVIEPSEGHSTLVNPYMFLLLSRSNKAIVVQMQSESADGESFEVLTKFPALGKAQ